MSCISVVLTIVSLNVKIFWYSFIKFIKPLRHLSIWLVSLFYLIIKYSLIYCLYVTLSFNLIFCFTYLSLYVICFSFIIVSSIESNVFHERIDPSYFYLILFWFSETSVMKLLKSINNGYHNKYYYFLFITLQVSRGERGRGWEIKRRKWSNN